MRQRTWLFLLSSRMAIRSIHVSVGESLRDRASLLNNIRVIVMGMKQLPVTAAIITKMERLNKQHEKKRLLLIRPIDQEIAHHLASVEELRLLVSGIGAHLMS
jgi:hypothetical protein